MKPATLADLRTPGHLDESVLEALRALSCSLPPGEMQDTLDAAIDGIESAIWQAEEAALWTADDAACRRAGTPELDAFTKQVFYRGG